MAGYMESFLAGYARYPVEQVGFVGLLAAGLVLFFCLVGLVVLMRVLPEKSKASWFWALMSVLVAVSLSVVSLTSAFMVFEDAGTFFRVMLLFSCVAVTVFAWYLTFEVINHVFVSGPQGLRGGVVDYDDDECYEFLDDKESDGKACVSEVEKDGCVNGSVKEKIDGNADSSSAVDYAARFVVAKNVFGFENENDVSFFVKGLLQCSGYYPEYFDKGELYYPRRAHVLLLESVFHYVWAEVPYEKQGFEAAIGILRGMSSTWDSREGCSFRASLKTLELKNSGHPAVSLYYRYLYQLDCEKLEPLKVIRSCLHRLYPAWCGYEYVYVADAEGVPKWEWQLRYPNFQISMMSTAMLSGGGFIQCVADEVREMHDYVTSGSGRHESLNDFIKESMVDAVALGASASLAEAGKEK